MNTQIKCPYCSRSFEPTDAYKHELEEKMAKEIQLKHQEEIGKLKREKEEFALAKNKELEAAKKQVAEAVRLETEKKFKQELQEKMEATKQTAEAQTKQNIKLQEQIEDQSKLLGEMKSEKNKLRIAHEQELEETRKKTTETVRKEAEDKIRKELENKITLTQEEAQAREKQNKELQEENRGMIKQMRELKDEKDKLGIEYEKKLLEDQDKIKQAAKKEAREELDLRIAEKDKKLQDAEKQILELQRKIQQGSQPLQGEVLELNVQRILTELFPDDEIAEVEKFKNGSDIKQLVRSRKGMPCGKILWECKRTNIFKADFISKLKEDLLREEAQFGIIVTTTLPKQATNGMAQIDGIWVCSQALVESIGTILREALISVAREKWINENKGNKGDQLIAYFSSTQFAQQVRELAEALHAQREQVNKERTIYTRLWADRETQIDRQTKSLAKILSSIQGFVGSGMQQIEAFDLLSLEEGQE